MNKALLIISVILIISGCASPGPTVKQDVKDPGPMVVTNPLPAAERITVGIARFDNEAIFGSGLFTDASGDRIEKQAYELLAWHLMETERFNVVKGQDIGKLAVEAVLMGLSEKEFKKDREAVALIFGTVVELGRNTTGNVSLLSKEKEQRARARVVLRLVDPTTGQLFYTEEGLGDAVLSSSSNFGYGGATGFDSNMESKAIDAAIGKMINNLVLTLEARRNKK